MITFKKLRLVNEMITHLVVCQIIAIIKISFKIIEIDLSKQQALDNDPKAIQQINFIGNLDNEARYTITLFIIDEAK